MKVAVLTRYVHDAGGVEAYLESVIPEIAHLGHQVAVWYEFAAPAGRHRYVDDGVPARRLRMDDIDRTAGELAGWDPDVLFLNGLSIPSVEMRLTDGRPTVTFLHGYHGTCISGSKTWAFPEASPCTRDLGPACLVQYFPRRCGGLNPLVMVDGYRQQRVRQELLKRSTFVATFSEHMRREAIANGVDGSRAVHLPPFSPSAAAGAARMQPLDPERTSRFATDGPWHVAFVGRMEQLKGAHLLIDALGLLAPELRSRLRVTFAGDGRERNALERAASRLADAHVTFTGWIDAGQREQLFSSLDLLVVPSVWPEPLGLIGLEAATAGVPAVAFDVGGIGDWLEDGVTGRLVQGRPPSSRALAAAIADALADVDRLRAWGVQARERARRHTIRAHVEALDAIFRRAAEYHLHCSLQ